MLFVQVFIIVIISYIICYSISSKNKSQAPDDKLYDIVQKLMMVTPETKRFHFFTNDTESFTQNKKEIYICLKDKDGNYYSDNFLMYVGLHELAHGLIPEDTSHHPPKYTAVFNDLKNRAAALGFFNHNVEFPTRYCKKELTYYS